MTGIYTGEGRRDWIFYTFNLNIFGRVLNRALAELPLLPLRMEAEGGPRMGGIPRDARQHLHTRR